MLLKPAPNLLRSLSDSTPNRSLFDLFTKRLSGCPFSELCRTQNSESQLLSSEPCRIRHRIGAFSIFLQKDFRGALFRSFVGHKTESQLSSEPCRIRHRIGAFSIFLQKDFRGALFRSFVGHKTESQLSSEPFNTRQIELSVSKPSRNLSEPLKPVQLGPNIINDPSRSLPNPSNFAVNGFF